MDLADWVTLSQRDLEVAAEAMGLTYGEMSARYTAMLLESTTLNVFALLLDPETSSEVVRFNEKLDGLRRRPESLG